MMTERRANVLSWQEASGIQGWPIKRASWKNRSDEMAYGFLATKKFGGKEGQTEDYCFLKNYECFWDISFFLANVLLLISQ